MADYDASAHNFKVIHSSITHLLPAISLKIDNSGCKLGTCVHWMMLKTHFRINKICIKMHRNLAKVLKIVELLPYQLKNCNFCKKTLKGGRQCLILMHWRYWQFDNKSNANFSLFWVLWPTLFVVDTSKCISLKEQNWEKLTTQLS